MRRDEFTSAREDDHYKFVRKQSFLNGFKAGISNPTSFPGRSSDLPEVRKVPIFGQKPFDNRLRARYLDRLFFKGKLP
jgi:hypothetical protein